jgi:poly-gamma-glutamate capsule biosynthesis protein CapA/YwtB (metallophosphatase superfamily)
VELASINPKLQFCLIFNELYMNRKIQILLIIFFALNVACQNSSSQVVTDKKTELLKDSSKNISSVKISDNDTITIIGVGDMMLGTKYPSSPNYLPPNGDCSPLLSEVKPILLDADITFGNCEGVIADDISTAKGCNSTTNCYRFCMPEKFADCFLEAGFDILSIGNNHVEDLGTYGSNNTVKVLKEKGFHFAGLTSCPYTTFEKNSIKYGFTAFAPNSGTNLITDIKNARSIVKHLDSICDIVIVSFHGGAEGVSHQHVTRQTETFLGQDRGNVYEFAHAMIDEGADLLFGQGPHVTRAVEVYKNRLIMYSLGNFCTYNRFSLTGPSGLAPIVKVFVNKKGEFYKAKVTSVEQYADNGPKLDSQNRALKKIQELTKSDFPELNITIQDNGEIFIRK